MTTSEIGFSLAEKLAIVQSLDSVILADGLVHKGEINVFAELMQRIDFDSNFLVQARNLSTDQALLVLESMSKEKKILLAKILNEMAKADGFVHVKEIALIQNICKTIGILKKV